MAWTQKSYLLKYNLDYLHAKLAIKLTLNFEIEQSIHSTEYYIRQIYLLRSMNKSSERTIL